MFSSIWWAKPLQKTLFRVFEDVLPTSTWGSCCSVSDCLYNFLFFCLCWNKSEVNVNSSVIPDYLQESLQRPICWSTYGGGCCRDLSASSETDVNVCMCFILALPTFSIWSFCLMDVPVYSPATFGFSHQSNWPNYWRPPPGRWRWMSVVSWHVTRRKQLVVCPPSCQKQESIRTRTRSPSQAQSSSIIGLLQNCQTNQPGCCWSFVSLRKRTGGSILGEQWATVKDWGGSGPETCLSLVTSSSRCHSSPL